MPKSLKYFFILSFVTFDNYPYSKIIGSLPTVIDINMYDMGIQAGSMMIRKLENPNLLIQSYTTLPILIQGQSTILNKYGKKEI